MSNDTVNIKIPTWLAKCLIDSTKDQDLYQMATMTIVRELCYEALKEKQ